MHKFTNFFAFLKKNIGSDNENKTMDDHRQYIMTQKQKCLEESRQRQISETDLREEIDRQYRRSLAIQHRRSLMCETYSPHLSVINTFDMDDDYFHVDDGATPQKSNKLKAVLNSVREKGRVKKFHTIEKRKREDELRKQTVQIRGKTDGQRHGKGSFEEVKRTNVEQEKDARAHCTPGVEKDHQKEESEEAVVFSEWLSATKTAGEVVSADVVDMNLLHDFVDTVTICLDTTDDEMAQTNALNGVLKN